MEDDHLLAGDSSVSKQTLKVSWNNVNNPYDSVNTNKNINTHNSTHKLKVDDILNFIGYGPLQAIAFVLAGLTAISYGLEAVIFAFIDIPVQHKWNLSTLVYTILPSTTGVSNIAGGLIYSLLCDRFGRVWPYAMILAQIGVFGLASAFSPNFATLIVFRNLVSVATTGAASVVFPTFIEFLPVRNRGKVMVSVTLIQALGTCAAGGLAWWLIPRYKIEGWRYLLIATSLPQFVAVVYRLVFNLQSPRYLIARGRLKEARKVFLTMARLNRKNLDDILPRDAQLENVIQTEHTQTEFACQDFTTALLLMFKRPYLRTTILMSIIFVTETGAFYASSTFLPKVLQQLGASPYFTAFVGYLGQIPGILLMSIIMEWPGVGRLNSLRFFSFLSVVFFLLFAFVRNQVALPVFTVLIYFSMVPMLSLLFTYVAEIYPTTIRTFASGYFNNLSAAFGIVAPFLSGYLSDVNIYWLYPTVWAGVFFVQFLLSLLLNRETLGSNLTDTL